MFNDIHTGDVDKLIAAANAKDWPQVHEINHALKGVTGNLAATDLYELCIRIDTKVKREQYDFIDELNAMLGAMATLLESIEDVVKLPV